MPENKFAYIPTSGNVGGVRSFGEQVKDVACPNFAFFNAIERKIPVSIVKMPSRCFPDSPRGMVPDDAVECLNTCSRRVIQDGGTTSVTPKCAAKLQWCANRQPQGQKTFNRKICQAEILAAMISLMNPLTHRHHHHHHANGVSVEVCG